MGYGSDRRQTIGDYHVTKNATHRALAILRLPNKEYANNSILGEIIQFVF